MVKKLLAFACLASSISVNAATVSYNGYSLNTETNIVTGEGLRWLQWDETLNLSINDARVLYPTMRIATNQEMASLFNAFELGKVFVSSENQSQGITAPYDDTTEGAYSFFNKIFGSTCGIYCGRGGLPDGTETEQISSAWFGSDADADMAYNLAAVQDDYLQRPGTYALHEAYLWKDLYSGNRASPYAGVALVQAVPIPAAAWLFGSALLGLRLIKRKKL